MLPDADHTMAIHSAEETPFAYGEGTVMKMQSQSFDIQDELGTMMVRPNANALASEPAPLLSAESAVAADEDRLARLERKLDLALRHIEKLQQRLESLDITLARTLMR